MTKRPFVWAAICGLALTSSLQAQTKTTTPPPKLMQIYREVLKPGHGAAHTRTEAGWPAAFAKANWPTHYLALTSTSGPSEAWFISAWDSYAAYEKDNQDIEKNATLQAELDRLGTADGEHVSSMTSIFAAYREDLSYRPAVSIPEMRYFQLTTWHLKPGRAQEFAAARKLVQAVHEKLNMDEHWAMYQVSSGAPSGTYLMLLPIKSLADIDAARETHGKAYEAAIGEEDQKKIADLMNASVESSTNVILSFNPKMSYAPKEWAVADAFWTPRVERAAVTAPAKVPAKKTN
jgi:hypothetical protein